MKGNTLRKIIGGSLGFLVGIIVGGYLGLIIGGTFLGGFDIYENFGIEGYEITTYIGALIGAALFMLWGIRLALRTADTRRE